MKEKIGLGMLLFAGFLNASAAVIEDASRVEFREGRVWALRGGEVKKTTDIVALPFSILVETNGSYTVSKGKPRQLQPGEILGRDGMLLRPDGTITPVMDHLTMNRNRVLVMRDGEYQEVSSQIQLGGGLAVRADGKLTMPNGSSRRLLDGELFQLAGVTLPARDTITVQDGQVFVQKDGSMIALGSGRTIMMNNGTKVFSDGTMIDFYGRRGAVADGGVAVIEGVVVRPR